MLNQQHKTFVMEMYIFINNDINFVSKYFAENVIYAIGMIEFEDLETECSGLITLQ